MTAFLEPEDGRLPDTDAKGRSGRDVGNEGDLDDVRASGALEEDMPARGEDMDGRRRSGLSGDMQTMDIVVAVNVGIRSWALGGEARGLLYVSSGDAEEGSWRWYCE